MFPTVVGLHQLFCVTIQHRPRAQIVTEDALSRRPDMEDTALEDDTLSLPDPDEFSLPGPSGPPSTLTAALILPSHVKPPMDDNGLLVQPDVHGTPEYSAKADIAHSPSSAAVLPDDLANVGTVGQGPTKHSLLEPLDMNLADLRMDKLMAPRHDADSPD